MKIYTRTGDLGQTSLFGGTRVSKHNPRIEAYGTVDELSAFLGVARTHQLPDGMDALLAQAQSDLFEIGAHLASPGTTAFAGVVPHRITMLEHAIDEMEAGLPQLTSFILPGGSPPAAALHVARTVCRRAERCVVALSDESAATTSTIAYLNRLSDYLFVAARLANLRAGGSEVRWSKAAEKQKAEGRRQKAERKK